MQKQLGNQKYDSCKDFSQDQSCQITRDDIKAALKKVYTDEAKPVSVGSIRARTGLALMLILLGAILIAGMIGIKYLALEQNLMIIGILLLLTTFSIGFLLSTKDIRKIYLSMSRFKDSNTPSYRTILPKSNLRAQGLIYATLLCLILLGAQSWSFIIVNNNFESPHDKDSFQGQVEYKEDTIWLDDVILDAPEEVSGQLYRKIIVEINNSRNYYSKNLILEIQSQFAGKIFDKQNTTLDKPDLKFVSIPIKVHEADDTTILTYLKHYEVDREKVIDYDKKPSEADIYIVGATGRINQKYLSKSIEITVVVYNQVKSRAPDTVSVKVTKPSLLAPDSRGSAKNNETIKRDDFWEVRFELDILDEESNFEVELIIDEDSKDKAEVLSG